VAYFIVTACERTWARVHLDRVVKLTTKDVALTQTAVQHRVVWKGPQLKYIVLRLSDDQSVKSGFANREDAEAWMREHERIVSAPA